MKFYSIIILFIFFNFTALPSIAVVFGFDIPTTNIIIQEEENLTGGFTIFEKNLPKVLDINDFLKYAEVTQQNTIFVNSDSFLLNPHLTIFSPPPEA